MIHASISVRLALGVALAGALFACATAVEPSAEGRVAAAAGTGSGGSAGSAGSPLPPAAGGGGLGAAGGPNAAGGTGLTSGVFGPGSGAGGGAGTATVGCEATTSACDWSRLTGCCKPLACERASGTDVFNTYPVESCQALVTCVQAHPGCSTASDPLCFQDEAPGAPCLQEGYQASHTDPDGPFAWTEDLVRCVCGY